MNNDEFISGKKQLERKLKTTKEDREFEKLKERGKEEVVNEKYRLFCDRICKIMHSSAKLNLFDEFKKPENFDKLVNSDKIYRAMKKFIINTNRDELASLVNKNDDDFIFDREVEFEIKSERDKNIKSFIENVKNAKKANGLKLIGEIKTKFENNFPQKFHIIEFEEKLSIKLDDVKFNEDEIKDINDLVEIAMINKFKELINKELNH
jgi:hypothetical protein